MRKLKSGFRTKLGLLIFLIPCLAGAQVNSKERELHCLWKVQGSNNIVYLLGAVHMLPATNYPLANVIDSAFANSKIAVFETDIDKLDESSQQTAILEKFSLPEGQTLKQNLSPKVYNSLSNHAAELGLPMQALERYRPVAAIQTLQVMELATLGADLKLGVDKHFFELARDQGKRIIPLETTDFEIGLLAGLSKPEEDLMVEKSLEEIDVEKKFYAGLVLAWQTGDSVALEKMLNQLRTEAPSIFKKLVSDRTASWIPQFEKLLQGSQNAIVIVGAGHLVGPDGAVELLKKKGFKVTQL